MPITKSLFGDALAKDIKACDSMSFIGKSQVWRGRGRPMRRGQGRYAPYPQQHVTQRFGPQMATHLGPFEAGPGFEERPEGASK